MKHKKKPRIKKLIPPHLRIPFECGTFTHTANKLYDLIFSFGLGGCWMSNHTISHKIRCSVRSVQYARQQLVKQQAIITARTCPRTWIMWAGNHRAVQNCQVLLYPRRQKMDNPFYILDTEKGRFCTQQQWGAKIAPKSDVSLKDTNLLGSQKKEAVKNTQQLPLSQGSAPNPASSSGLTSNLLAGGLSIDKTTRKTSSFLTHCRNSATVRRINSRNHTQLSSPWAILRKGQKTSQPSKFGKFSRKSSWLEKKMREMPQDGRSPVNPTCGTGETGKIHNSLNNLWCSSNQNPHHPPFFQESIEGIPSEIRF